MKKSVHITATTGIASLQYRGLSATTLHHWAGLLDGRYTKEKITKLIQSDEKYTTTLERIKKADVLIIDEIGMLSK